MRIFRYRASRAKAQMPARRGHLDWPSFVDRPMGIPCRWIAGVAMAAIALVPPADAQVPKVPHSSSATTAYTPKLEAQPAPMRVSVINGVTFEDVDSGAVYRLFGVDACAAGQSAMLGRQSWPCGAVAIAWLVAATLGKWIACSRVGEIGGVFLVRCATAEHPDLALAMLRDGEAIADESGRKLRVYDEAQTQARKSRRGLWASQFQVPWDYRRAQASAAPPAAPRPAP